MRNAATGRTGTRPAVHRGFNRGLLHVIEQYCTLLKGICWHVAVGMRHGYAWLGSRGMLRCTVQYSRLSVSHSRVTSHSHSRSYIQRDERRRKRDRTLTTVHCIMYVCRDCRATSKSKYVYMTNECLRLRYPCGDQLRVSAHSPHRPQSESESGVRRG